MTKFLLVMTMSKEKKRTDPAQLPEIVWHEPTKTNGWFEVKVPITWEDFMGIEKVKAVSIATLNIVDAIRGECKIRLESMEVEKAQYETEVKTKQKEEADAKKLKDRTAAITKIIKDEPDLVMAKRNELGVDVLDDKAAAAVIYQERQDPPKKPKDLPKSAAAKKAAVKAAADYTPDELPEGDFGETVRFYKSDYGWSAYLDGTVWEEKIPVLFDWLVSIPKEIRHRTGTKYPCISHSGKFLMVNDFEKDFITTAVEAKGLEVEIKED